MFDSATAPMEAPAAEAYEESGAYTTYSSATGVGGELQQAVPVAEQSAPRMLIRTSSVDIETLAFDDFMNALDAQITRVGGYVEESNVTGTGLNRWSLKRANIRIRIPNTQLDSFEAAVAGMGNVVSQSSNTEDVTLTYVDIESRIEALKIEQESLLALLKEEGATLEQLFKVQSRLTDVRAELSSFESRRRVLQDQVAYSTITLSISEVETETPVKKETGGEETSRLFSESLKKVGNFFTRFGIGLVGYSPVIIVWLIIIGLSIFLPVFFTRRSWKKRESRAQAAQQAQAALKSE